jgi:mitotic spindle assembly checkpoint protein MAD2B
MDNNIFVEFIEIYINQVIYLRGVYPRQIFRKHKAYALPVYCSIYPPLNDYLKLSLKTIQKLIGELKKVEVLIYNENKRESFMIEILKEFFVPTSDTYLISTHDIFRRALYDLELKCRSLCKFSRSSKFKILLHTNEKAYQKLNNEKVLQARHHFIMHARACLLIINPSSQDSLWIKQQEGEAADVGAKKEILPVSSSSSGERAFMSLYIEQFTH